MRREPVFRIGDFAIWSTILGAVVAYQCWNHATEPALTTIIAIIEPMAS